MSLCAYFVSDIHLKNQEERNAQVFARFLSELAGDPPTHLFLVGDIFDLWVSDHSYFVEKFSTLVGAIKKLQSLGVQVHYFEGNHDLHLERFWQKQVGIRCYKEAHYFDLDGFVVRVEHGDLIDPEDKGYLFLKSVLQSWPMKVFAERMPGAVIRRIGERASHASRDYTSNTKTISEDENRRKHRNHAHRAYQERPYDLLVSGHIHLVDDYSFKEARAINLGSWLDGPKVLKLVCSSEVKIDLVEDYKHLPVFEKSGHSR